MHRNAFVILLAVLSMPLVPVHASIASQSQDIIIMEPPDLPEAGQIDGESMELHGNADGTFNLYVEQQQLHCIAIFDVTNPGRIKLIGNTKMELPAPFDFVRPIGESTTLICFRNNRGSAVIDFRKPKEPTLVLADTLRQAGHTESIGDTGLLIVNEPRTEGDIPVHDYQVVDSSNPRSPRLLLTVDKVHLKVMNYDTGTMFLLGAGRLTVVRRPRVEGQFRL